METFHVVYTSGLESTYEHTGEVTAFYTAEAAISGGFFSRLDIRKGGVTLASLTAAGVLSIMEDISGQA